MTHPSIGDNVLPAFENFLKAFSPSDLKDNIITLYDKNFKLESKEKNKK